MKTGAIDHPKMGRLMRRLAVPRYAAVGLMELLWNWVAEYSPTGSLERFTVEDLELAIGWDGEHGAFVEAAAAAGFLDPSEGSGEIRPPESAAGGQRRPPACNYAIHGWSEHAPDYVHARVARKVEKFADGTIPNMRKLGANERLHVAKEFGVKPSGGRRRPAAAKSADAAANGSLPKRKRSAESLSVEREGAARETPARHAANTEHAPRIEDPEADRLADRIEARPGACAFGSQVRRGMIAELRASLPAGTVDRAITWLTSSPNPQADRIWGLMARYPDGVTADRIDQALRLAATEPPPPPPPRAAGAEWTDAEWRAMGCEPPLRPAPEPADSPFAGAEVAE